MKRFLLDTGIAFDYINRRHGVFERGKSEMARGNRLGVCTPILGELFAGVENSKSRDKNLSKLLKALSVWANWPFTQEAAREYGRLFAELKQRGRLIQQIDLQTAAVARTLGNCTVVSKDTDFRVVSGLSVVKATEEK